MLFLAAAIVVAMYGSMRAALLTILLSVFLQDFLFDRTPFRFDLNLVDIERAIIFMLVAILVSRLASTRRQMVARLSRTNAELQAIFDHIPVMLAFVDEESRFKLVNREWERILGWSLEETQNPDLDVLAECYPDLAYRYHVLDFVSTAEAKWADFETKTRDGRTIDTLWANVKLSDGTSIGIGQDVTERKHAEAVLREAERKYRDIFENAGEGIFQSTPEGKYIAANPALARMHGFDSPEDLIRERRDISTQIYADPGKRVEFQRLLEQHGTVRGFEHQINRKDGSKIWISVNARAVRDEQGQVGYYEGTAQDISERKRAEEALRESEELFSKAFHSSPAPLILTRLVDGCFLNANDAFLRAFEYERDEVIGKTVRDLNIYVDRQDRKNLIDQLKEQGSLREYESQARTKSGRILNLLVFVEPIKLKGEECILSTAYDITERKSIEEALRESEERYRELFENAKDALYVHDLGGRYTSFNRAAEQLSGFSREEILGKHFSNFVAPGSLRYVRENFCKKLDEEGVTVYEIDLVTKDRRRVPVEVSSRLIYEKGKPVGVQGVARDMTERKRAQEALRTYSQRLIEAQEAERQVIARELHDEIGQVLTVVRINLQSLQHSAQSGSQPSSIDDSLIIVDEALDRVRELSLNLRPSVLDNLGLSSALRWYVDRYARRSGIVADLQSDLEDGRRLGVELETACFRIVQEALTNVVRHARATRVLVRLTRSNGNLDLEIKDNGVGFNVDALLKASPPVWALGLRGMEERAIAVQGHLEIESTPMRGTEVRASFSLKDGS